MDLFGNFQNNFKNKKIFQEKILKNFKKFL